MPQPGNWGAQCWLGSLVVKYFLYTKVCGYFTPVVSWVRQGTRLCNDLLVVSVVLHTYVILCVGPNKYIYWKYRFQTECSVKKLVVFTLLNILCMGGGLVKAVLTDISWESMGNKN